MMRHLEGGREKTISNFLSFFPSLSGLSSLCCLALRVTRRFHDHASEECRQERRVRVRADARACRIALRRVGHCHDAGGGARPDHWRQQADQAV